MALAVVLDPTMVDRDFTANGKAKAKDRRAFPPPVPAPPAPREKRDGE